MTIGGPIEAILVLRPYITSSTELLRLLALALVSSMNGQVGFQISIMNVVSGWLVIFLFWPHEEEEKGLQIELASNRRFFR